MYVHRNEPVVKYNTLAPMHHNDINVKTVIIKSEPIRQIDLLQCLSVCLLPFTLSIRHNQLTYS